MLTERSWWIRALGNHQPYRPYQGQTRIWHLRPDLSAHLSPHTTVPHGCIFAAPGKVSPGQGRQLPAGKGSGRRRRPSPRGAAGVEAAAETGASLAVKAGQGWRVPSPKAADPRLAPPRQPRRGAPLPCREPLRRTSVSAPGCRRHSTGREQDRPGSPITPEQPGRHGHRPRTVDRGLQTRPTAAAPRRSEVGPQRSTPGRFCFSGLLRLHLQEDSGQGEGAAPGQSGSRALATKRRQPPSRAQSGVFGPQRQSTPWRRMPASSCRHHAGLTSSLPWGGRTEEPTPCHGDGAGPAPARLFENPTKSIGSLKLRLGRLLGADAGGERRRAEKKRHAVSLGPSPSPAREPVSTLSCLDQRQPCPWAPTAAQHPPLPGK